MSLIKYSVDAQGIAHLQLHRPEKLNAFSRALCDEYLLTLTQLESDIEAQQVRVLVLGSTTDKAFCAGADLKERESMTEMQIDEQLQIQRAMMDRTAALAVPTIAVINGIAFGGGLELALACDLRVAHEGAQMGLTELRLGIIPGSGGTQRLTRLVGLARAREMIHLARPVNADRALAMGLVNDVGADTNLILATYLESILKTGPLAQQAAKRAINEGYSLPLDKALDHERHCYATVLRSQDRLEGLAAFLQKRNPTYRGA